MYHQFGKCAVCNGKFDDTYSAEEYNTVLDTYFSLDDTRLRPYFCSANCKDDSIGRKQLIKERDRAKDDVYKQAESDAKWYDNLDDDEKQVYVTDDLVERLKQEITTGRERAENNFRYEQQRRYRKFFDDYARGMAARIEQEIAVVADTSTKTVIDGTDQMLPQRASMNIDLTAIADVAGLHKLPKRYEQYFGIIKENISQAAYEGSFYSQDPNEQWGQLIRLCVQNLKPLIADDSEGYYVASLNALEAAPDPIEFLKQTYLLFQTTKNGKPSFSRLYLQKLVRGSPSMTHDELWDRVDRSTTPNQLASAIFDTYANGPNSILATPFPIRISDQQRYEHAHVLAPTGMGKTVLLLNQIIDDLQKDNPPGMIIIDPKGSMVGALSRLDLFHPEHGRLRDRLIILDATGDAGFPELNLFAPPADGIPLAVKKSIEAKTVDLLEYVFSSAEFKLTGKQSLGFTFLARLIFATPNADLMKLFRLIQMSPKDFASSEYPAILDRLDIGTRLFFESDFFGEFNETKSQIKARLYMAMETPELTTVFNAKTRAIDWFDCIQKRKIILVHTGMTQLKARGSQFFGRYVISSVVSAIFGRSAIPKDQWHPTFLWIDEAQLLVDEYKTQEMLSLVREYCLGITLAHQQMTGSQFNDNIRNSISTNTAIKYAAGLGPEDLRDAAKDLHCAPEFITSKMVEEHRVNFACFVRNHHFRKPFHVSAPKKEIERQPVMDEDAYQNLLKRNKELVSPRKSDLQSVSRQPDPPPLPTSPTPTPPPITRTGPHNPDEYV